MTSSSSTKVLKKLLGGNWFVSPTTTACEHRNRAPNFRFGRHLRCLVDDTKVELDAPFGTYTSYGQWRHHPARLELNECLSRRCVSSRTAMNFCFLLTSFSISAIFVQVDFRPTPFPTGSFALPTTVWRSWWRDRRIISLSFSASAARSSSNLLPRYLVSWLPCFTKIRPLPTGGSGQTPAICGPSPVAEPARSPSSTSGVMPSRIASRRAVAKAANANKPSLSEDAFSRALGLRVGSYQIRSVGSIFAMSPNRTSDALSFISAENTK